MQNDIYSCVNMIKRQSVEDSLLNNTTQETFSTFFQK